MIRTIINALVSPRFSIWEIGSLVLAFSFLSPYLAAIAYIVAVIVGSALLKSKIGRAE